MRDASARMWASWWRVRWGGVCGLLTIRDQVPLFLRQENVYLFDPVCVSRGAISFTPRPPPHVSQKGVGRRPTGPAGRLGRGPLGGPKFGPPCGPTVSPQAALTSEMRSGFETALRTENKTALRSSY